MFEAGMRALAVWVTAAVLTGLVGGGPAAAQFSDVARSLDSAIRKAQRAITPKKRRRSRRRRPASVAAETQTAEMPPPPVANPRRHSSTKQVRVSPNKIRKTADMSKTDVSKTAPIVNSKADPPEKGADSGNDTASKEVATTEPDVWSAAEIEAAGKACKTILSQVKAELIPVAPMKKGPCGAAAAYKLTSLGGSDKVVFSPAPVLNCKMVAALDRWLRRGLQPLARKHLGAPITRVSVMSSYSCRNAYGRTTTRLSEHALANALDIGGFVTADGKKTQLLAHWGPTQRDILAQKRKAEEEARRLAALEKAKAESPADGAGPQRAGASDTAKATPSDSGAPYRTAAATPQAGAETATAAAAGPVLPPLPERRPSLRQRLLWAKAAQRQAGTAAVVPAGERNQFRTKLNRFLYPRNDLGGPKPPPAKQRTAAPAKPAVDRAAFLRGAHRTACRIFGTVLGPEANEAHRNHFHVDLAPRKRRNYCR